MPTAQADLCSTRNNSFGNPVYPLPGCPYRKCRPARTPLKSAAFKKEETEAAKEHTIRM